MDFEKLEKQLHNHMPLIGAGQRRKAAEALAADGLADAVPLLVEALGDKDEQVVSIAKGGLRGLKNRAAIDRFCALWQQQRSQPLNALLAEGRYIASQPVKLRVETSLFARQPALDSEAVPSLVEFLNGSDVGLKEAAAGALRALKDQKAIDQLCSIWASKPNPLLDTILRARKYIASQPVKLRVETSLFARQPALDSEAVPSLVEFLNGSDAGLKEAAAGALRALKDQKAIDQICSIWAGKPNPLLNTILRERKYIASQPVKLRVATSIFVGQPATDAEAVPSLVEILNRRALDAARRLTAKVAELSPTSDNCRETSSSDLCFSAAMPHAHSTAAGPIISRAART